MVDSVSQQDDAIAFDTAADAATSPSRASAAVVSSRTHVPALDGLRGLAILMVLAHDFNLLEEPENVAGRLLGLVLNSGWLGVQLFFVLSGFLITGILLDTRDTKNYLSTFLGRRALRIFPIYYVVLFGAFVVAPLFGRAPIGAEHQVWAWLYLANWAEPFGKSVSIFPNVWSLAIEEQFYLVWPLLVRWLRPRTLAAVSVGLVVLAFASRVVVRGTEVGAAGAYMFTVCRVDALAIGAIAALLVREPRTAQLLRDKRALLRWYGGALLVVTVFITKGAPRVGPLSQTFGYTVFAVAFALLVLDAVLAPVQERRFDTSPALQSIGRYSYAMYLFHTPLHILIGAPLVERLTGTPATGTHGIPFAIAYFVGASAVTLLAAMGSYHLVEKHFLGLKRFLVPRRA